MTREEIIRMAREAGLTKVVRQHDDGTVTLEVPNMPKLERFAARVAAAEREACAKRCERVADDYIAANGRHAAAIAYECAGAIRATGEKP